jgi:hypothetical protein
MTPVPSPGRSRIASLVVWAAMVIEAPLMTAQEPGEAGPQKSPTKSVLTLAATDGKRTQLRAGVAAVDITNTDVLLVNDRLYAKALVVDDGTTTVVIITVDAVAIAEIGTIKDPYLANVRAKLQQELGIAPPNVLINASHCHGVVCADVEERTVQAVREAQQKVVPVTAGAGVGHEDRIMENRRLKLKSGKDADVRHAYSLPPDDDVVAVGPVDPEIGILRLNRENGQALAVVYNFACHPIQGVPNGGNTADVTGFASKVIEESLAADTVALFLQGCGGDINPVLYKDVEHPRDAEPLGMMLGLSTLKSLRQIKNSENQELKIVDEIVELPRRFDGVQRLEAMQAEQKRLLESLRGTSLNLKTFLPLVVKYNLSQEFPSYSSHRYLHDRKLGRNDFDRLDAENRKNILAYMKNIEAMERLTRLQTNMDLVRKHQATNDAAGKRTISAEIQGIRIGDFVMATFPGELTVQIGLNLKKASPHDLTFIAGYSNGYLYYAPTADQLMSGEAQEDCDCLLAPEWQKLYEQRALELLKKL